MKYLFIISLFMISNAHSYVVQSQWSTDYKKTTSVICTESEQFCKNLCDNYLSCKQEEGFCRDCAGTSMFSTYLFKYIGLSIVNSKVEALENDVLELIGNGNYVTISSKSIFNHLSTINSKSMKRKFRSLCFDTEYPHIIIKVSNVGRTPREAKYVSCNDGVYELSEYISIN